MKNINTIKATLCIAAATLMSTFYGCRGTARQNENQPVNVAVVNASNANSVCLDMAEIQPAIADACKSNGYFSYIIADGDPFIGYHDSIFIDGKNLSSGNYNRRVNSKAVEVSEIITTWTPKTDEVDLLKALNLAAKDMAGKDTPTIIVYTNGLSTVGKLDIMLSENAVLKHFVRHWHLMNLHSEFLHPFFQPVLTLLQAFYVQLFS